MSIQNDVAAEIASELASLQAEESAPTDAEEAAPDGDNVETNPDADEESEEIEETEPVADSGDIDSFKDELATLIDAGDLKAAAEKLGLDPSVFKLNNRQFKAARHTANEAKAAEAAAKTKAAEALAAQTKAEQLNARAEEIYGPAVAGKHHYKNGDVLKARAALELLFDDTYENIVTSMARGAKGLDPAQVEVLKLRRELEAERTAKAAETAKVTAEQQQASEVAGIAAKLKGTPLEDLGDEAAQAIHATISASFNKALGKHTVTLKEAYAKVKADYAAKAAKLAKLTGKAAPRTPAPAERRTPLKLTPAPAKPRTVADEFAAELAAAKKDTAAAARRDQRRAR
jgi:hypothetical protein